MEGIEIIRFSPLLQRAFKYIIENSTSNNLPYHNINHLLTVLKYTDYIAEGELVYYDQRTPLHLAALFHDVNHSGGKLKDCDNILLAITSFKEFAKKEKPILGICNGFQILCEAGLLPGALLRNQGQKFKDEWAELKVNQNQTAFSKQVEKNQIIKLPIAHGEGQYFAEAETLKKMNDDGQIWLTYQNNPNGSALNIAGVTNQKKNICGLMPHPERALYSWMGSTDGMYFL